MTGDEQAVKVEAVECDGKIYVLKNYVMEQAELIDREIQQDQNMNTYRAAMQ